MDIIYLEKVDSTHTYLKKYIKENGFLNPIAIVTRFQTNGVGSRENEWCGREGNLFFSFVVTKNHLPDDLKLESASIYFSFLLKEIFSQFGSKVWLKWPNDFYVDDKKIGGTITTLTNELLLCGIGINIVKVAEEYGILDVFIDMEQLLINYFDLIEAKPSWKDIFSKFEIEFKTSREYKTTVNKEKVSLVDSVLLEDGSIMINNKKVYSSR
ncbi:MAG: biotin--[acetyl-CoA-carboxylase] ligase [Epsilonproteobacteria bacterium]|nr:biotin--[acetyl-CoA-carboxylase] ligase [Campylobacterota bacterium]